MPKNNDNTLEDRINYIKLLTEDFLEKETISDLTLFHLLNIFLHRSLNSLTIFTSLEECIKEKAEDKEILLYLFLNTLEEEAEALKKKEAAGFSEILGSKSKNEIEQQINNSSSSELPEPSLYKGWGFRFSEAGISEQNGKLHIEIDDIFEGSKLTEYGIKQGNTIIIDNPATFKTDGQFNIGKIARHIRMQELLTAIKSDGEELEIEQGEKTYFYQDEEKGQFMAFSIKEDISIEEARKQEDVILVAHERVKQKSPDTTTPTQDTTTPTQNTTTPTQDTTAPTNTPANPKLEAVNNSTEQSL